MSRLDSYIPLLNATSALPPLVLFLRRKLILLWPLFLLRLWACQTHVIQEIPLLCPRQVTIATGTRTCRCRPLLACSCAHAHWFPLPLHCSLGFVLMVRGISQVMLYRCAFCHEEVGLQIHSVLEYYLILRVCLWNLIIFFIFFVIMPLCKK